MQDYEYIEQQEAFDRYIMQVASRLTQEQTRTLRGKIQNADWASDATHLTMVECASVITDMEDLERKDEFALGLARDMGIMLPSCPGQSTDVAQIVYLQTEEQKDSRDNLLSLAKESDLFQVPTLAQKYRLSINRSSVLGTGTPMLESCHDVLEKVRLVFHPSSIMNWGMEGVPTQSQFTAVYDQLRAASHQLICVDPVSRRLDPVVYAFPD